MEHGYPPVKSRRFYILISALYTGDSISFPYGFKQTLHIWLTEIADYSKLMNLLGSIFLATFEGIKPANNVVRKRINVTSDK
jgi:hypothetical protein